VTSISSNAFSDSGLTSVTFHCQNIGSWFSSNNIWEVVIGDEVKNIGQNAFRGHSNLTSVTIPNSVTTIGSGAFMDCKGLTSIIIPKSVTSIGSLAFSGCNGLTSITSCIQKPFATSDCWNAVSKYIPLYVPYGTKEMYHGLDGWKGFTNIIELPLHDFEAGGIYYNITSSAEPYTVAVTYQGTFNDPSNEYLGEASIPETVTYNGIEYDVTSIGMYAFRNCDGLTSVTIPNSVTSIGSSAFYECTGLTSVTIPESVTSIGYEAFSGCSGLTSVTIGNSVTSIGYNAFSGVKKVLVNRGTSSLIALWEYGYVPKQIGTEKYLYRPNLTVTGKTQTSLSYKIENWYDEYEYHYEGNVSKTFRKSTFYDNSLAPNSDGGTVYVRVPGTKSPEYSFKSSARTLPFNTSLGQTAKTASSLSLKGMYSEGDAVVTKQVLSVGGKSVEGNEISLKGLTPNSSYSAKYVVTIAYGNKQTLDYTKEVKFNTDPLTLITEQPKVVSLGNVIVSAKANVDDEEENVGFEWRRTDWTDDFKSNTGTANMYEGTMEGYIRNLNTDKLWKFRPYYLANDGTYYYGDWIGLDPTNTSYFEPTVHTYAKIDVTGNTALVKGYALGGTDNITVQGFKYWKAANLARAEYGDRADVTAVTIPANAQTIEAEGRVMEATLSGLDYESTYYYVAFAKTAEGTYYGDVKTFTTGVNTTGIERIDNSQLTIDNSRRAKGIYTLTGVKVSDDAADVKTLKSGIYIVNGKKVAVK